MQPLGQHALVIGASIGGLLAARVLTDYYEQVTICDRDAFATANQARQGVPQGQQGHALLTKGQEIIEEFFPGLTEDLVAQGAVMATVGLDGRWFDGNDYHCRVNTGLMGLLVSRPRLESQMRARLLTRPNVSLIERCAIVGLIPDADNQRITGVRVSPHNQEIKEHQLKADLVVDASGRGSSIPALLEALGYPRPQEERMNVDVGYATRRYRREPQHLQGDKFAITTATPEIPRVGVLLAQEQDCWVVSLGGYAGHHPPTDDQGFLEFARGLASSDIYDIIQQAQPLSDPVPFKFVASQRRHFEQLSCFPEGLLVFGDAICSFNPFYAQGMAVAAQQAQALQGCLSQGSERLALRFFKQTGPVINRAWTMACNNDLRIPTVEGQRTVVSRLINWYTHRLHTAAHSDPLVAQSFYDVAYAMASPLSLFKPQMLTRVLFGNCRDSSVPTSLDKFQSSWPALYQPPNSIYELLEANHLLN